MEHESYAELGVKWVSAEDLKRGDKVLLAEADSLTGKPKYGIVEKVQCERLDTPETTYNLEVEGYHTYFVGSTGVCVHNAGECGGKNYYDSIKDHPDFPDDFQRIQNGKTNNPVKNKQLLHNQTGRHGTERPLESDIHQ